MLRAHGLGGGADLPIPPELAIAGGAAALVLSFVVLVSAWRRPRFAGPAAEGSAATEGRTLPRTTAVVDHPATRWSVRILGAALFLFAATAAVLGQDNLTNPVFGIVYVWLWVGIVPASLLFGPFYRAISPVRTAHLVLSRISGNDPGSGVVRAPRRLGLWPAAVGLFAFVWLELVVPDGTALATVNLWFTVYLLVTFIGASVFGTRWLEQADPFEVFSTLVGRLSPWGRSDGGLLVVRNPFRNLAGTPVESGLVAVVAVLLGSTAFDSLHSSSGWLSFVQAAPVDAFVLNSAALLLTCAVVGAVFALASGFRAGELAHSLVPIIIGYFVAHYLSYFVEVGQQTLIYASDPLSDGADLFGTRSWEVDYWLSYQVTLLASVKVVAIVAGHVVGAVSAHDRFLAVLPVGRRVTGQLPLLAVMVLYTFTGLYLLFGGPSAPAQ
ncbi:hypothetical protein P5G50_09690 [Leifsonia sp. F6_8S_P_1B]|uniref:Uncharacterized protein n=1 Tax=Leifsonia williamsii TaxID=3035919 RepID=A0ABT8KBB3_9MICO|nr:hypothetical protein [Leifsonia williamsii]MDN4614725.1 hypothetical protein [Leifsonia williamsii]